MKKPAFLLSLFLVYCSVAFAQGMGATFDVESITATPQKVALSFRSFQSMPSSYSLEPYCPTPGNQGNHGTCTAFANGYGIATILYAKTHEITDRATIDKHAFSPSFLYEMIKNDGDNNCQNGSDPVKAIITMITAGDAFMKTVPYNCNINITDHAVEEASSYKAKDLAVLYAAKGMSKDDMYFKQPDQFVKDVKKALSEGTPVSGGFHIPESFFRIKSAVWEPDPNEGNKDWKHNGHAMVVVGYDDNKAGGAFRILNSWGTNWADGGFVWIKYNDFARICILALQVFADPNTPPPADVKPKPQPEPKPQPQPKPDPKPQPKPNPNPTPQPDPKPAPSENTFSLKGDVEFQLNTGEAMPIKKTSTRNLTVEDDEPVAKEDLVAYTMAETYSSDTKFRMYLNVDKEAYVYAFATDLKGHVNRILPYADNISTLVGANSTIAFPSDTKVIKMDENKGRDYLLILYSATKLDTRAMTDEMNSMKGALSDKIKKVLGNKLIDKSKIEYYKDKVGFATKKMSTRNLTVEDDDTKPTPTGGTVVPLMVEIKHN